MKLSGSVQEHLLEASKEDGILYSEGKNFRALYKDLCSITDEMVFKTP